MSIATSQQDRKQYRRQKLARLRAKQKARAAEHAEHAHPLDPLSADELERVVEIVQRHPEYRYGMRFGMVSLVEPSRVALCSGSPPPRAAEVVLIDNTSRGSFRGYVDLDAGSVRAWQRLEGQPAIAPDEFAETELAVKMDGRVLEALRRRGLDLEERSQINVDPWSAGYYGTPEENERRIARALIYVKHGLEDNQYAHVVDGVSAIVDLNDQEVVAIEDVAVLPVPQQCANWAASHQERFRTDIKPLEISQPEGPSFTVEGNLVRWQKWQFRVGFTPREGLVLHDVAYDDDGEHRSLFHRISVAEMTVPYGDNAFLQYRKNAFDIGEYGVGILAEQPGARLRLPRGDLLLRRVVRRCVRRTDADPERCCMHEEDDGILWKHYDFRTDKTEVRRSRKLVVSFIATVATTSTRSTGTSARTPRSSVRSRPRGWCRPARFPTARRRSSERC